VEGDSLTITVANPGQGTLARNADGSYAYKPKKGYTGADSFAYTVSDGKLAAKGTISLNVRTGPKDEEEDCNDSSNIHRNNSNRSASVIVTSSSSASGAVNSSSDGQAIHYVLLNSAAAQPPGNPLPAPILQVNWQGASSKAVATSAVLSQGKSWLSELINGSQAGDPVDLGKLTGLTVKL